MRMTKNVPDNSNLVLLSDHTVLYLQLLFVDIIFSGMLLHTSLFSFLLTSAVEFRLGLVESISKVHLLNNIQAVN